MNTRSLILAGLGMFILLNASLMALYLLMRPSPPRPVEMDLKVIKSLPPFTLTSQAGVPFSSESLAGKVWIADFIFTSCPGPCPIMTKNLAGVSETLKMYDDVAYVSISVDPETDTPEVLARFAERYGADPARWTFLTGAPEAIQSIAADSFMLGSIDDPMIHSPKFTLVDKQGRIRGYYTGTDEVEVDQMITAVHLLRKE